MLSVFIKFPNKHDYKSGHVYKIPCANMYSVKYIFTYGCINPLFNYLLFIGVSISNMFRSVTDHLQADTMQEHYNYSQNVMCVYCKRSVYK